MAPLLQPTANGDGVELTSPTAMPKAAGFLWNSKMMIHITCRGYATAQFMQPEPAKYAHAPNLEAKTFMQPEQGYYAHHPGRFVYIRDDETGELFSAPYEPMRTGVDRFKFTVGKSYVSWSVEALGLRVQMKLVIPTADVVELWTVQVTNMSGRERSISLVPYFPFGNMSWMNQSGEWRKDLWGIVGSSITPYQKAEDHVKNKTLKDKTYFLCETPPTFWEASQAAFEGEGGLHAPSSLEQGRNLANGDARYENPAASVQYELTIQPEEEQVYRFLFGPALDDDEIQSVRSRYLSPAGFESAANEYTAYVESGRGCLGINTSDKALDNFLNHWLGRQCFYHGDVNRLTTDPQTRNYLQDNMGMSFIKPPIARKAFLTALSQQEANGSMPDGILLAEDAELKYINQVPHTDHCVWLPVTLEVYLAETGDYALLDEVLPGADGKSHTVFERFSRAMDWLLSASARDARGLSYIAQGDWCDPMNMVGPKGIGVSGWLTLATGYALNLWAAICAQVGQADLALKYTAGANEVNLAANKHFWDGKWFARGITDAGTTFGIQSDPEGRIWLNPQTWSILSGAASSSQIKSMINDVEEQLYTPFGVAMFGPPYSKMREDIGRVTQKFPGSAENASIYNHAAIFYVYSLYTIGESDKAYHLLRQMIPGPSEEDYLQRGQLPVFIPNYYRGAWKEYPRTAGRSSQLFNTGTVSWVLRCFVECLAGLKGVKEGLSVKPQMPSHWDGMKVVREFRGATFQVDVKRGNGQDIKVIVDGQMIPGSIITEVQAGKTYVVQVVVPVTRN